MAVILPTPGQDPWDATLNAALTGLDNDLQGHKADADPHTGYQKESEKAVANGYAGLDGTGKVPAAQLPTPAAAVVDDSLSGAWFSGKKWSALGTSITIENTYTSRLGVLSGMTLTNLGSGGATLCSVGGGTGPGGNGTIYNKMLTLSTSVEVITMETINDWRYSLTLGTIADANNHALSYYGALKEACEWILTNRPAARFVMFTAYPDAHPGTIYPNGKGLWHWEYNDAMRRVGNLYGVPVINVGEEAGINRQTSQFFTTDMIHMNAKGGERYGDYAWSRLRHLGWLNSRPTTPGAGGNVAVTGVTLSVGDTLSVAFPSTTQLSATIAPTNATNKGVTWTSSVPAVATVSMDGLVTAVKDGNTVITVTTVDGNKTDTSTITVASAAVTGVTVSPTTWSGTALETTALTATVAPVNAGNEAVTWSSSNPGVATVNSSGVVTGVAGGSTTITATTAEGGFTSTCAVTIVAAVLVTGVSLTPPTVTLNPVQTSQLTATVSPANAANKAVTYSTSNASIATVSATGLVTTVAPGTATITVTTTDGGFTDTTDVTVQSTAVTGVTVTPDPSSVYVGSTTPLTATVAPANALNKTVNWTTSAAGIATVSAAGVVTGVAVGSADITATTAEGSFTDTSALTVSVAPQEWTMRDTTVFRGSNLNGLTTDGNGDPTYTNVSNSNFGIIWISEEGDNACEFEVPPGTPNVKGCWNSLGSATDITTTTTAAITCNTAGNLKGVLANTAYTNTGSMIPDASGWVTATWLAGTVVRMGRSGDRIKIVEVDKATGAVTRIVWDALMSVNFAGHESKFAKIIFGVWAKGVPSSTYMLPINCKTGIWTP